MPRLRLAREGDRRAEVGIGLADVDGCGVITFHLNDGWRARCVGRTRATLCRPLLDVISNLSVGVPPKHRENEMPAGQSSEPAGARQQVDF
jgi:hypothetical protein